MTPRPIPGNVDWEPGPTGSGARRARLEQVVYDLRHGLRTFRRQPALSGLIVLTLGVGIALSTSAFTVVNAVLLRPLSYPEPARLMWIGTSNSEPGMQAVRATSFFDWSEHARTFTRLIAYDVAAETVPTPNEAVQAQIAVVTNQFWEIAGARPIVGRLPTGTEEALLLTQSSFEQWFGADPAALGRQVRIVGRQYTILGVLPRDFRFELPPPTWPGFQPREIQAYRTMVLRRPASGSPFVQAVNVVGQLRPGATPAQALSELENIREAEPGAGAAMFTAPLQVMPAAEKLVGRSRALLLVLLGAALFVLLVACANVANLLVAQSSDREKEIAIRASLGANRWRVLRHSLIGSTALACAAGVVGLFLARTTVDLLIGLFSYAVPRLSQASIDASVLLFVLAISLATALIFGTVPAVALWKPDVHAVLRDAGSTAPATSVRHRFRSTIVAGELAVTVVLLIGTGLMVKSFWVMTAHPPGFTPGRVLTMRMTFSGPTYRDEQRRRAYIDELLQRVGALPHVEAVGITTNGDGRIPVRSEQDPPPKENTPLAAMSVVSAGYGDAIGMRLVSGRWFSNDEPFPVVVVNEALVRREFSGSNPLGQRIQLPGPPGAATSLATVVGVVADLKSSKLDAPPDAELYVPYSHGQVFAMTVMIRTPNQPEAVAASTIASIRSIDKTQAIFEVKTLEQVLTDSVRPRRFSLALLSAFGGVALLLSILGIYGVVAHSVVQRTREIGLRIALGAKRTSVTWMIVRDAMGATIVGIGVGIAGAFALTRLMGTLLYEVEPTDPATFAAVTGVLLLTVLVACLWPATRASRCDPVVALRYE